MSEIVESLERMKARISTPDKWATNCAARNAQGSVRNYANGDAVAFCLDSALRLETPRDLQAQVRVLLESCVRDGDFIRFNDQDGRKHEDVLRLIDRAIAKAERIRDGFAALEAV